MCSRSRQTAAEGGTAALAGHASEEGMRSGEVAPLPWTVFARGKTQDAFRYLASGAARARGPVP